jgi:hypothetical protein
VENVKVNKWSLGKLLKSFITKPTLSRKAIAKDMRVTGHAEQVALVDLHYISLFIQTLQNK